MSVVDRSWASRFSRSRRASSTGQTTMSAPASVSRCLFFGLFATDMIRGTPNSFLACLVAVILARSSLVATRRRSVCDASAFLRMSGLDPSPRGLLLYHGELVVIAHLNLPDQVHSYTPCTNDQDPHTRLNPPHFWTKP